MTGYHQPEPPVASFLLCGLLTQGCIPLQEWWNRIGISASTQRQNQMIESRPVGRISTECQTALLNRHGYPAGIEVQPGENVVRHREVWIQLNSLFRGRNG